MNFQAEIVLAIQDFNAGKHGQMHWEAGSALTRQRASAG